MHGLISVALNEPIFLLEKATWKDPVLQSAMFQVDS